MTNDEQPTEETTEAPIAKAPLPAYAQAPVRKMPVVAKPRRLSPEDPAGYKGGRYVSRTTRCGWCMDGIHGELCRHEIAFFDKLHVCACDCNKDWTPQDLGTGELFHAPKVVTKPVTSDEDSDDEPEETPEEPAPEPAEKVKPVRRKTSS